MQDKVKQVINQLRNAKTIQQIIDTDLPQSVCLMKNTQDLKSIIETEMGDDNFFGRNRYLVEVQDDGSLLELENKTFPASAKPFVDAVLKAEKESSPNGKIRTGARFLFNIGFNKGGQTQIHADSLNTPKSRIYLFRDKNPTLCVSHKDMVEPVQEYVGGDFLNENIDMQDFCYRATVSSMFNVQNRDFKHSQAGKELTQALNEKAVPMNENELCVMAGLTFHAKQDCVDDGLIFRGVAYEP